MSGSRVTRLSVLLGLLLVALDLTVTRRLDLLFESGFVLLCVFAALAVRPRDFFRVGVLPPLLLLGLVTLVALVHRGWVAAADDSLAQAVVSGLTQQAGSLLVGYLLALTVLAIRGHVRRQLPHSKRVVSPAPTLTISGPPSEKSTTVVGSEPHSPESMTASNQ